MKISDFKTYMFCFIIKAKYLLLYIYNYSALLLHYGKRGLGQFVGHVKSCLLTAGNSNDAVKEERIHYSGVAVEVIHVTGATP